VYNEALTMDVNVANNTLHCYCNEVKNWIELYTINTQLADM